MRIPLKKILLRVLAAIVGLHLVYAAILAVPEPMFAYHTRYQNFDVWSDEPIPSGIASVLDDTTRRLSTSAFYDPQSNFRIFICNSSWRLWLYGMHFDTGIGGSADVLVTRNIVIRTADIANNAVRMPPGERLQDEEHRPLSYFIAHEAAHIVMSRAFGRTSYITRPEWLTEGFADFVGKGGDFGRAEHHNLYRMGALNWPPRRYKRFHLELDFLVNQRGMSFAELFADPPSEETVRRLLDASLR